MARKTKAKEEAAPVEGKVVLNFVPSVPAFRAYLRASKTLSEQFEAIQAQSGDSFALMDAFDVLLETLCDWLTTYGGVTGAELDTLVFWDVVKVFQEAAAAFIVPKTKSAA